MDLTKLITKRINEYALNGDANFLDQYGFLITMIAKEYAAQQLILSGVSQQRELLELVTEIANSKQVYSNTRHKLWAKKLISSNCG